MNLLSETIKSKTAGKHQALDQFLLPVFESIQSKEDYTRLLLSFYKVMMPLWEAAVELRPLNFNTPEKDDEHSPAWILKDLRALGTNPPHLTIIPKPGFINNAAKALGVLYVLKGSTLGGVYLAALLKKNPALIDIDAFSYFTGYGSKTKSNWLAFTTYLNEAVGSEEEMNTALAAADAAYDYITEHFKQEYA